MLNTITVTAGQRLEFHEPGDFFRILAATSTVNVEFYAKGKEIAEAVGVGAGYAEKFDLGEFDRIAITSAAAQTIQFVTRLGNVVQYDAPPVGNVTVVGTASVNVMNSSGAFTQAQKTVTNASGALLAAKTGRRYLLIQNNDAAGIVYVNLAGATAAEAGGIKIEPGGSLEIQGFCPSGAINAIGSIASNANVTAVEA